MENVPCALEENEFKYKWVKLTSKKTEISRMDLRKKQDLTVIPLL